jgi:hypothetical protein
MKLIKSKKGIALLATLVVVAIGAVGAFAYFTSTGAGSGSAAVGTAADNLVVTGTADTVELTPGGLGSVISFTVANPSDFNQQISNIHLVSITADAAHSSCVTTVGGANPAFTLADVSVGTDGNIAPNATAQALTETGTLSMNDTLVNQDSCKDAALTLTFSTT